MSTVDANRVILTGENSVIRLSNHRQRQFHDERHVLAHPVLPRGGRAMCFI